MIKGQVNFQEQTEGTLCVLYFLFLTAIHTAYPYQQAVLWGLQSRQDGGSESSLAQGMLPHARPVLLLIQLFKCLQGTEIWWELGQLEALCVEAVPFFAGHSLE